MRPATSRRISGASIRLKEAQDGEAPVSDTMVFWRSGMRVVMRSVALRKMSRFWFGGRRFHDG